MAITADLQSVIAFISQDLTLVGSNPNALIQRIIDSKVFWTREVVGYGGGDFRGNLDG